MENSKLAALAVIGLIIGATGLGLGVIGMFIPQLPEESGVVATYYKHQSSGNFTNPTTTYIDLTTYTIQFEIKSGEAVYYSFSARGTLVAGGNPGYLYVFLVIDGSRLNDPSNFMEGNATLIQIRGALSLQHYDDNIAPGVHTVWIQIWGSPSGNYMDQGTLLVQILKK